MCDQSSLSSIRDIRVMFVCKLCEGSFGSVNGLLIHKREHHFNEFQSIRCIVFEEKSLDQISATNTVPESNLNAFGGSLELEYSTFEEDESGQIVNEVELPTESESVDESIYFRNQPSDYENLLQESSQESEVRLDLDYNSVLLSPTTRTTNQTEYSDDPNSLSVNENESGNHFELASVNSDSNISSNLMTNKPILSSNLSIIGNFASATAQSHDNEDKDKDHLTLHNANVVASHILSLDLNQNQLAMNNKQELITELMESQRIDSETVDTTVEIDVPNIECESDSELIIYSTFNQKVNIVKTEAEFQEYQVSVVEAPSQVEEPESAIIKFEKSEEEDSNHPATDPFEPTNLIVPGIADATDANSNNGTFDFQAHPHPQLSDQISNNFEVNIGIEVRRFHCSHPGCFKSFKAMFNLQRHETTHLARRFPCEYSNCGKSFARAHHLKVHNQQKHEENGPFKKFVCSLCGKMFDFKHILQRHLLVHTEEKPYLCRFEGCKFAFKRMDGLLQHERVHTGYRPHQCEYCEKSYTTRLALRKHKKVHPFSSSSTILVKAEPKLEIKPEPETGTKMEPETEPKLEHEMEVEMHHFIEVKIKNESALFSNI